MIFETQEQLDAALARWQRILRLQDWDIRASLRPRGIDDTQDGHCIVHWRLKSATIRIVNQNCEGSLPEWPYDCEHILVHELLHIPTHPFAPDKETMNDDLFEQHIDSLAKVLVALERE